MPGLSSEMLEQNYSVSAESNKYFPSESIQTIFFHFYKARIRVGISTALVEASRHP